MTRTLIRIAIGVALLIGGLRLSTAVLAQTEGKTLPTLLIKGEVVALDTNDPAASLLKVKDRYGFETPIFLTTETKITEGEQASTPASLIEGTSVEVEYNFDINTAKRHAVLVRLPAPEPSAEEPAAAAPDPAEAPAEVEAEAEAEEGAEMDAEIEADAGAEPADEPAAPEAAEAADEDEAVPASAE